MHHTRGAFYSTKTEVEMTIGILDFGTIYPFKCQFSVPDNVNSRESTRSFEGSKMWVSDSHLLKLPI